MNKIINAILESNGFDVDIDKKTLDNTNFREVLFTGNNIQLVVMSIKDEIGVETHNDIDQFFRVEGGVGQAIISGKKISLKDGVSFIVPKGTEHNVINTGKDDLKIYTIYSPPNHPAGTVHKTREEAMEAERQQELEEAGFEENPRGWDKKSIKKYTQTFTKRMKGGAKAEGFFDKCVEKMKDKMDNPEGFCASLKDEAYGSTGWRGKDKSPAEVSKSVKKAKFKIEANQAINDYLEFIIEGKKGGIVNDGAPLPNNLIHMLEYDEQPNWIGGCIRKFDGMPQHQIKCLQAVKEYASANPFYQYRIDRYIDRIMNNWENQSSEPYP
ncbi:MAG: cupin domain-containing protein, partial [Promethearchaeota archaeon]